MDDFSLKTKNNKIINTSKQTNQADCWCNVFEFGVQMERKVTRLAPTILASAKLQKLWTTETNNGEEEHREFY